MLVEKIVICRIHKRIITENHRLLKRARECKITMHSIESMEKGRKNWCLIHHTYFFSS